MNEPPGAADFLGRLVDRARGADSGLRPRLPSLFEPIRYTGVDLAMDAEPTGPIDEGVDSYILQPAREDGGTRAPHAARIAGAQRDETATAGADRQHVPAQPPGLRIDPSPAAPPTPASLAVPHARPAIDSHPASPASQDRDTPTLLRPGAVRARLSGVIGDPAPGGGGALADAQGAARSNRRTVDLAPEPEPARPATRAAPVERSAATPDAHPPAKSGALLPSPEPAVRRVIVVEPQTTRRRLAPEQARIATPVADPTPVVNVTIGRVEVRAVQPPPALRRAEAQGPRPMSLDDYLKQREGRR